MTLLWVVVRNGLFGTIPLLLTSDCHWLYVPHPPPPPIPYSLAPLLISSALCSSQTINGLEHGLV
jgi:hypothetical protein